MKLTLQTKIKGKEIYVECPVAALMKNSIGYRNPVTFLELVGPMSANRAIWSHMVKRRDGDGEQMTDIHFHANSGSQQLHVDMNTKYVVIDEPGYPYIIMDKHFGKRSRRFFTGGDEDRVSPYFGDAVKINLPTVPILQEWLPRLWVIAINESLVTQQEVFGTDIRAWSLSLNEHHWQRIIKESKVWRD